MARLLKPNPCPLAIALVVIATFFLLGGLMAGLVYGHFLIFFSVGIVSFIWNLAFAWIVEACNTYLLNNEYRQEETIDNCN